MAAALIPLIGALAPSIIDVIRTIITVEKESGSGNGLDKFKKVLAALMEKLGTNIPAGSSINQDALSGQIQGFVDLLNKLGVLSGKDTNVSAIMSVLQLLLGKTSDSSGLGLTNGQQVTFQVISVK